MNSVLFPASRAEYRPRWVFTSAAVFTFGLAFALSQETESAIQALHTSMLLPGLWRVLFEARLPLPWLSTNEGIN